MEEEEKDGRTTFKTLRGAKVYDADGEEFGHVSDIEMNLTTLNPTHLIIHKGFFGEYLRINMKYIDEVKRDKIRLWISPVKNLVGARVVDRGGTDIGRVLEAEKDKDGHLEYIRVETRIIETRDEEEELDRYIAPTMPFQDMSVTLPTSPLEEGPVPTQFDLNTEEIVIKTEDISDVHKEKIVLRKAKEYYTKK